MNIKEIDKQYIAGTYARFPLEIVSGSGSVVYDETGKSYIDLGSGIAVTSFGVSDNEWKKAVTAQLDAVQHTSNLYYTSPCALLAQELCRRTGMKKVFFSNSGAEANECAIKAARKYAAENKGKDHYTVITLENSFHGRTLTTLAATGQEHYHELYTPLTPGFVSVPSDIDALKKTATDKKAAAIMVECIQGEGGVIVQDKEFLCAAFRFAKENDIVFIVDEVQTGNGRTGKLYAYMNYDIEPDIVSTAKGLGGGLPIGATLLSDKLKNVFSYGDHGSTFGGNPVCCAGALNILSRIDDKLLSEVCEKGKFVTEKLKSCSAIESISGMGLMIGFKPKKPASEVISKCIDHGVLCLSAKNKVRLLPALNIPMETLSKAVDIIISVCEE